MTARGKMFCALCTEEIGEEPFVGFKGLALHWSCCTQVTPLDDGNCFGVQFLQNRLEYENPAALERRNDKYDDRPGHPYRVPLPNTATTFGSDS